MRVYDEDTGDLVCACDTPDNLDFGYAGCDCWQDARDPADLVPVC